MHVYTTRHSVLTPYSRAENVCSLNYKDMGSHGKEPNGRSGGKEVGKFGESKKGGAGLITPPGNTKLLFQL